jgi:pilus assembly protein CpaF
MNQTTPGGHGDGTDVFEDLFGPVDEAPAPAPAQTPPAQPEQVPVSGTAPVPQPPVVAADDPFAAAFAPSATHDPKLFLDELVKEQAASGERRTLTASSAPYVVKEATYVANEKLWPTVEKVLAMVSERAELNSVINTLTLTRDRAIEAKQRDELRRALTPAMSKANIAIPVGQGDRVFDILYDELVGISVLGTPWRDDDVTEIIVDGWDQILVERNGVLQPTDLRFRDRIHANRVARDLASRVANRAVSPTNPLVSAELPGARVAFAYGPVTRSGLSITIRKFRPLMGIDALLERKAMSVEMKELLADCVKARATTLISGGTGSGKTTIINALSGFIPDTERVITVEDAFELALANRFWLPLQTKEAASADDSVSITMADLLRSTLRMRPDRIIVGEIRDAKAASVMLAAANTGHDGTMTTLHAQDAATALNFRMAGFVRTGEGMPDAVAKETVALAVDLVVQVTRRAGRRFISEVATVDVADLRDGKLHPRLLFSGDLDDNLEPVFTPHHNVDPDSTLGQKLTDAGITRWFDRSEQ